MIYDRRDTFLVKLAASYAKKNANEREELLATLHPDVRDTVKDLANKAMERIAGKSRP